MGAPAKPMRVVHIEDEELDRVLFSRHLKRACPSAELKTLPDPVSALREFLQGAPPDLIVTDLAMPLMSGIELIGLVRKRYDHVPVIVLSSSDRDEDVTATRVAGADGYAVKFPSVADFAEMLRHPRGKWAMWRRAPTGG